MKYMVQEVQNMTNNNCGMVYTISHSQNTKKNGRLKTVGSGPASTGWYQLVPAGISTLVTGDCVHH